jgi:hypothetical protein
MKAEKDKKGSVSYHTSVNCTTNSPAWNFLQKYKPNYLSESSNKIRKSDTYQIHDKLTMKSGITAGEKIYVIQGEKYELYDIFITRVGCQQKRELISRRQKQSERKVVTLICTNVWTSVRGTTIALQEEESKCVPVCTNIWRANTLISKALNLQLLTFRRLSISCFYWKTIFRRQ